MRSVCHSHIERVRVEVHALFVIVFSPLFTRRVHTVFASTRAYECLSAKINGQFVPGALSPVIIILSTVTRESAADLPRSHYLLALVFDSPTAHPLPSTTAFRRICLADKRKFARYYHMLAIKAFVA